MIKKIMNKIKAFFLSSVLTIQEPEKILEQMRKHDLQIMASQLKDNTRALYSISNNIKDFKEILNYNNTLLECLINEFEEDKNYFINNDSLSQEESPANLIEKPLFSLDSSVSNTNKKDLKWHYQLQN